MLFRNLHNCPTFNSYNSKNNPYAMKHHLLRHLYSFSVFTIAYASVMIAAEVARAEDSLQLTLPKAFYAVPGVETGIYFANIVQTEKLADYCFEVKCDLGKTTANRWAFTATKKNVGQHELTVTVKSSDGKVLESQSTQLIVVPADAGQGEKIRLLIIGDSLTNATLYPNEIARLLSLPGNPSWEMLGSYKPGSAAKGVAHEGYGGWTWQRFVAHYTVDEKGNRRHSVDAQGKRDRSGSSPFVYPSDDGKPELNVSKYFEKYCAGNRPDFIIIKLGINDCFSAPYENRAGLDAKIDGMFHQADILIAALRQAAPDAEIGICLTTPGNSRDEAFVANYKDRYPRQGWDIIQRYLVQRQLKYFSASKDSKLSIIPTELYLDITQGYPDNNAVHPNAKGYQQIGSAIYCWLKWKLVSSS